MTRIARGGKREWMAQWGGAVMSETRFHDRDLFAVQRVCFESDIIQGMARIPRWGLWLPRQQRRQTQPRKWMCQITQSHPLGESCRCVQLWVSLCLREDIENFISTTESTLLPIFPLTFFLTFISLLSSLVHLFPHLSFSFVLKCCWGFFLLPSCKIYLGSSPSVSHIYDAPIFSFSSFVSAIIWATHFHSFRI